MENLKQLNDSRYCSFHRSFLLMHVWQRQTLAYICEYMRNNYNCIHLQQSKSNLNLPPGLGGGGARRTQVQIHGSRPPPNLRSLFFAVLTLFYQFVLKFLAFSLLSPLLLGGWGVGRGSFCFVYIIIRNLKCNFIRVVSRRSYTDPGCFSTRVGSGSGFYLEGRTRVKAARLRDPAPSQYLLYM